VATGGRPRSGTRERILEVALDLFAEDGFAGTTISAIERKVGLAAGTGSLHRHFRSKEELLHAAVDHEVTRIMAAAEAERAALPQLDDPDAGATQAYEQALRDIQRFDRLFRLLLTEGDRLPELRATMSRALEPMRGGRSSWTEDPTVVVAVAALGGYHYLSLMQGRPFEAMAQDTFIRALVELTAAHR
jgi:AcrR family transcriptional regulator